MSYVCNVIFHLVFIVMIFILILYSMILLVFTIFKLKMQLLLMGKYFSWDARFPSLEVYDFSFAMHDIYAMHEFLLLQCMTFP